MSNRNASPSAFGWDFQVNSAMLLMLENIKNAEKVRVEGSSEDIEITLNDHHKIYAQAKAVERPDDTSHVNEKLSKALETLCDAATKGDGSLFTYITNSSNPFNNQRTLFYFTGRTHLSFDELPEVAKKKIQGIIKNNGYTKLDVHKLDVRVIPFYGMDLDNRYKEIKACVNEFLATIKVDVPNISMDIIRIWHMDLFHNATQSDTSISISKEEMIWPLIVLVIDNTAANDYKKDFSDDEIGEIEKKYKKIINQETMSYEIVTRILSGFRNSRKRPREFVTDHWHEYLDIVNAIYGDESTKESLIKIILYRILIQSQRIQDIKKGTNL